MASLRESANTKVIVDNVARKRYGAIITWEHVKTGTQIAHTEDTPIPAAVYSSLARLVARGLILKDWRCATISTPQRIYRELVHPKRTSNDREQYEGKTALQIIVALAEGAK